MVSDPEKQANAGIHRPDAISQPLDDPRVVDIDHDLRSANSIPFEGKDEGKYAPSYHQDPEDTAVVVPRSQRRGLFGQYTLLAEVEDPKTYTRRKKWFITFIVAVAGSTAPMGSSIFFRKSFTPASFLLLTVLQPLFPKYRAS